MDLSFSALKSEYEQLFANCKINSDSVDDVQSAIAHFQQHRDRYAKVEAQTKVPWYVIAAIHKMEGDCDFDTHLHNGDSLAARTVNVPAGRPVDGQPTFTWEFSACDALQYDGLNKWDWAGAGIAGILYQLEAYNGFGYKYKNILSPYLWAGTNHYTSGKYTADGKFDLNAVSTQIGAAAYLKKMIEQGIVNNGAAHGGKSTLKIVKSTFLKQQPVQSSQLKADQKTAVSTGSTIPLLAYQQQADHFKLTLDHLSYNGRNTFFVYAPDVKIIPE